MSYNPELSGLEKLKKGSLYYIFSAFLAVIFIVLFIVAIFIGETFGTTTVTLSNSTSVLTNSSNLAALSLFSIAGILFIVALIIEILGIINLRSGFSLLSGMIQDIRVGKTGTTLWIITVLLSFLLPVLLVAIGIGISFSTGSTLSGMAVTTILIYVMDGVIFVLGIIANILVGIAFYKLGSVYRSSTVEVGGVLIATSILAFIGFILTYVGLGEVIRRVKGGISVTQSWSNPPTNIPIAIYQTQPYGTISPNGILTFQVYSTAPATLLSATIEGLNFSTSTFNPQFVPANQNTNVMAYFNPLPITQGAMYRIVITASVNGTIMRFVVNALGT